MMRSFLRGLSEAFSLTRIISFLLTWVGIFVNWRWPTAMGRVTWLSWVIPMLIFTHSLAWYLSKARLLRKRVGEIKTEADLEEALFLYENRMPSEDQHPRADIRQWWAEEQKRKKGDCQSCEIFLFTKQEQRVWQIFFATYSHSFLNVYAYAQRKAKLPFGDKTQLASALRDYANYLANRLLDCCGLLIEISGNATPRERTFAKYLRTFGMSLESVPNSFLLPDFSGNGDQTAEKTATLYYAAMPGKKKLNPQNSRDDADFLIKTMYAIYRDSYDDPKWRSYIAGLERRVLAAHQQPNDSMPISQP